MQVLIVLYDVLPECEGDIKRGGRWRECLQVYGNSTSASGVENLKSRG